MTYTYIIEQYGNGLSAYVPDLPGCVSAGETRATAAKNIREAIALHLEGLREDAQEPPQATTSAGSYEVLADTIL